MATKLAARRFVLGDRLGVGGEGEVWLAQDITSDRACVLKLVPRGDAGARSRLLAEFERLGTLACPQLPQVLAVGELDDRDARFAAGTLFVAMEHIVGVNATQACSESSESANEVARVLADAALALDALHASGLVHHDVKPAHLLRDEQGRYRLIDLGLARSCSSRPGPVRGTLAYLSPAALVGISEPAVDVFALGVTGYELLSGTLPYAASSPATLLAAQGRARAELQGPAAIVSLIDALLSSQPPSRAALVADELARAGFVPRPALRAMPLRDPGFVIGASRAALLGRLEAQPGAIALVGPRGSGRTRLVTELHRRMLVSALRDGATAPVLLGPTLSDAAHALSLDRADAGSVTAALVHTPALLYVERPDEPTVRALLDALTLAPRLRVVLELEHPPSVDVPHLEVGPLDADEVRTLATRLAGELPGPVSEALVQMSQGRPRYVVELVRAASRDGALTVERLRAVEVDGLAAERARVVARHTLPARRALATLALLGRDATRAELATSAADVSALELDGLVSTKDDRVTLESDGVGAAALAGLAAKAKQKLVVGLIARLDADGELFDAAWVAQAANRADAQPRARLALAAALASSELPPLARALALAERCDERDRLAGGLLFAAGEYVEAEPRLAKAVVAGDRAAATTWARCLRALGRIDEARHVLASITGEDEVARIAGVVSARLRLDEGEPAAARTILHTLPQAHDAWARTEREELLGLAALQLDALDEARMAFEALRTLLDDAAPRRQARADALLGMVAQADGALETAAACYESALALAETGGDPHGAAVYSQNLGGVLRELGEYGRALSTSERAVDVLARLGRDQELALAHFNLGSLQLAFGDLDAAEREATMTVAPWSQLLLADVQRRRDDLEAALATYEALRQTDLRPNERVLAEAGRAETCAELARRDDARESLRHLEDADVATGVQRHALLSKARVALLLDAEAQLPASLRQALEDDARLGARMGARERTLHAEILLLRDAARSGDEPRVHRHLHTARALYEEIHMRTPELRRAALADDPDLRRLVALLDVQPRASSESDGRLRRLLEINKRLNSELQLDRLLELILDTVIELSRAERGFLLLRGESGALEVRLERNVDAQVRDGVAAFSRSIAERAAAEGEPIVTVDATDDRRFESALSIVDLNLRSVLAVPLSVKGRLVGCVYVDHRARVGLFKPEDVALVVDLAEQAAIAVENARLIADNRDKEARVRALNAELENKLAVQTVELEGMHREVHEARRTLGVRHDYKGLVGNTPRMVELFRLLDRVTETALPVVIYGESGTGKELVARAIHYNGPRRKAAFVSESCAAIPETLLEAALFGHVRGAFTGAQGERRGLFEIADGGTLFLDEVGEMSAGMQVRLLRVLQEGEFRRVGGEKVVKVDVRVLVASNRDLGRMVEEGKFREDLFYRLNVVRVALPPLRERQPDIPLLVEHFLSRRADKRSITRRALDRLCRFKWPGNVRQLENELARAASLADGSIDLDDLSPAVQTGIDEVETTSPEPLDLHARVERLERTLVEEALGRAGGNQSQAARLLGLSRFGLQKKMTRYHIQPRR